ncbi:MAG: phosphoribosylanthranilate isomerase, partial [Clostridiales bacterium]|nr:phosphoribosylanthranilate isomerase [Clostridiales bacterium]
MIKVKICGLKRPEDISYVNEAAPEYAGFVFYEKSRRYVSGEQAAKLRKALSKYVTSVGVFVDADIKYIKSLYESGVIDIAQLHGKESVSYIKELKVMCADLPVIKAISADGGDIKTTIGSYGPFKKYSDGESIKKTLTANFLLIDNGAGGTGKRFDWSILDGIEAPYFLAGGIDLSNIKEALKL